MAYWLEAKYDSRNSFYGKATVESLGDREVLVSYNTPIIDWYKDSNMWDISEAETPTSKWLSHTTRRHVKEFFRQKYGSEKVAMENYKIYVDTIKDLIKN